MGVFFSAKCFLCKGLNHYKNAQKFPSLCTQIMLTVVDPHPPKAHSERACTPNP